MADTDDDERMSELEPAGREEDGEGAPGERAAGVDRRAKEWEAGADLTRQEALNTADEEEADADRETEARQLREELEQDALEERDLEIARRRDLSRRDAEVAEALRLARSDDLARDNFRSRADAERRLARQDRSRATALDAGAAGRDDPRADADRAKADRYRASARIETNRARYDDATADSYSADGQERRLQASEARRPEQPPAAEAAFKPPRTPVARKNVKKKKFKDKELGNFGLGD
ncbi:hypothetical protein EV643_101568 [Kribbella sp. VKM Ac-2527]|uniref:Colicin import membrane protein n=1 Tax=Kribbella caucasensis TaxID=2512215 RepID=A0A4R6KUK2_9ACTN|nr:hypothetical protein [Kribbella sp. VKM Ac-2527]TDO54777.1 hypothetical protein EV643_101568 [Kribbella sp. VKM Ac-2527]